MTVYTVSNIEPLKQLLAKADAETMVLLDVDGMLIAKNEKLYL